MKYKWYVDFTIEPDQEVSMTVHAETSRDAMMQALTKLELTPDELLHSIFAHISRPSR